ncbi:MAG: glycosyltransferase family 2 protein [Clostridiaceae bacterium]|nr:glycosyltransferase family 2 protein [Clostridiaceae bacterium]
MVSISLCMIVKNEEKVLARCLESLAPWMDEIIIVDTGSEDRTKEIAAGYTDQIYDFAWTGSFSDARNFAASKATKEYIYTADADEYLDELNQKKLAQLKSILLPEVEIVQMLYCTKGEYNTVYNFEKEYRPKLYRRLRRFVWIDPIHETLRIDPIVYDSQIEIIHAPEGNHAGRDLAALFAAGSREERFSKNLHHMYAMELFISGEDDDFVKAIPVFEKTLDENDRSIDEIKEAICVLARAYRVKGDTAKFFNCALKDAITASCAEICCELGKYYEGTGEFSEAILWYQNAATETESILDIRTSGEIPQQSLERLKRFHLKEPT